MGQSGVPAASRIEVGGACRIDGGGHVGKQEAEALMINDLSPNTERSCE